MNNEERIFRERYEYKGYMGCESHCHLRLFLNGLNGASVAVVTELDSNDGTSVTNVAEFLAQQIITDFGIDYRSYVHIEHYPPTYSRSGYVEAEESFSRVSFTFDAMGAVEPNSAEFAPLTATEVANLTMTPVIAWKLVKLAYLENLEPAPRLILIREEILALYKDALEEGDMEGVAHALALAYEFSKVDSGIDQAITEISQEMRREAGIEVSPVEVEAAQAAVKLIIERARAGANTAALEIIPRQGTSVEAQGGFCERHGMYEAEDCPACAFERRLNSARGNADATALYDLIRELAAGRRQDAPDSHLEASYEERTDEGE